jgi:hypothetical protein
MSQEQAKKRLIELLNHFSVGTLMHFIGEHYRQMAEAETQDEVARERLMTAEAALFVMGYGIDGACQGIG